LLARAWIQVSTDAATSNNQKNKAFWLRVQQQQNSLASWTNKLNASSPGYTTIPEDRSLNSLKRHWKKSLHPAVNKFVGIVSTNPLVLGEQKDASYYARMRDIYAKQANNTSLPDSFVRYMDAHKFLNVKSKVRGNNFGCRQREW